MEVSTPDAVRVLVVDDCHDNADILGALLEREGCDVRIAYNAFAAVKVAAEFRPHVALLDIGMAECDGYCLAQRFRRLAELASVRLIAVTGYADAAHRERAAEAGFDDYMVKPYSIDELNGAINSARRGSGQPDFRVVPHSSF